LRWLYCASTLALSEVCVVVVVVVITVFSMTIIIIIIKGNGVLVHAMKACRGVELQLYSFLTLALNGIEWSATRPGRFTPW
jgi:uncharacterized membrane protein YqiK